ncbi:MAG: hypothetical protein IKY67_00860 [Paludibacteraceae bacterium]|nr:hypothetical protein [Paludibacteraceae bacterium]
MNFDLKKVPSLALGLLMTSEFIFAQVIDDAWGVFFVWVTFLLWEIWYLKVLDSVRVKAEKYYNEIVGRFKLTVGVVMAIETIFSVMRVMTILGFNLFSGTALGVFHSARFLAHSVLFIWQITMLLNAYAASMSAEDYKNERGRLLLSLIFAPLGAMFFKEE